MAEQLYLRNLSVPFLSQETLEGSKYGVTEEYPNGFTWLNDDDDDLFKEMTELGYDSFESLESIDDATWLKIIGTW